MRNGEHPDDSGDASRPSTEHRFPKRQGRSIRAQEHWRSRLRRSGLAAVEHAHLAGACVVIGHEGAAADARALRLDQRQHGLDGDRSVDRASAAFQHFHPGASRERVGGDDEALLRGFRRGGRLHGGTGAEEENDRQDHQTQQGHTRGLGHAREACPLP